ncbi:MAG: hypothetical protein Q4B63_07730 [Clostridium perfringens]|nr:hypothetical protein [Clostridium perfringens]
MLTLVIGIIVIAIIIYLIIDFLKNGLSSAGRRRKFMWLAVILLFIVNEYAGAIAVLAVVAVTLVSSMINSKRK